MNIHEAVSHFKNDTGYQRLFDEMIKKYRSYGRIAGEVTLHALRPAEREAIGGLFRIDVPEDQFKTSLSNFERMLARSVFEGITLKDLLSAYVGDEIISNKQAKEEKMSQRDLFFSMLASQFPDENLKVLFASLPRSYLRLYDEDSTKALYVLPMVFEALAALPLDEYQRLPLFSDQYSKDPKFFDADRYGRLLTDGMKLLFDSLDADESELYAEAGILKDDVHNFVSASGLISNYLYWQKAYEEGAMLNIPLREADKLNFAAAATGTKVFVVENSGLFSAILDCFNDCLPPLLCLHGQPKASALQLLDRLVESGMQIYYSGDFDPEGLMICERLWSRYGNRFTAWRMGDQEYQDCLSPVEISPRRLSMLKNIQTSYFENVMANMNRTKRAGYQERLLPLLLTDIRSACDVTIPNINIIEFKK